MGRSFGYNRAEGENESIAPDELIYLLVDIVSKNGKLLLDVGPEADGTILTVQMERLQALGAWRKQDGAAIYALTPGLEQKERLPRECAFVLQGQTLRFAQYCWASRRLGRLLSSRYPRNREIFMVGRADPLTWSQQGSDMRLNLPSPLPGKYAYVLIKDQIRDAGPVL